MKRFTTFIFKVFGTVFAKIHPKVSWLSIATGRLGTVHILAHIAHNVDIIQQVRGAILPRAQLITIGQLIRIEHRIG